MVVFNSLKTTSKEQKKLYSQLQAQFKADQLYLSTIKVEKKDYFLELIEMNEFEKINIYSD